MCSRRWLWAALLFSGALYARAMDSNSVPFDSQWRFVRNDVPGAEALGFDDRAWEMVTLPHTAHTEALVTGPVRASGRAFVGTTKRSTCRRKPATGKSSSDSTER